MNNLNPLISVIIPCYNAEKFVGKAIQSIIDQTYHHLEIIVIDDCSNDNTESIIEYLSKQDIRIRHIKNDMNLGLAATLNKGISLAKGQYIARMDSDDISIPTRLEKQIDIFLKDSSIDLVSANVQMLNENDEILPNRTHYPNEHNEIVKTLPWKCQINHPLVLAKKDLFTNLGGYKENIKYGEDYELWIRAWLAGKKFYNVPDILLYYRTHSNQMSNSNKNTKNQESIRSFLFNFFKETNNPLFLFGIVIQTKIVQKIIYKTYSLRKRLKGC